jgi:dephospho-CoA kinase
MLLVGLTGGIGAGKSSVAARLERVGAVIVDADAIVHELQSPGQPVLAEMVELFGDGILHPDGSLDRQAVADVVFHDKEKLARLGEIVHPRVRDELFRRVAEQAETDHIVILDIPLLAESGWEGIAGTIVVDVDPDIAIARLVEHRGFSEEDARARIANQASREERLAKATWIVDNSGTPDDLEVATMVVWEELVAKRDEAKAVEAGGVA